MSEITIKLFSLGKFLLEILNAPAPPRVVAPLVLVFEIYVCPPPPAQV